MLAPAGADSLEQASHESTDGSGSAMVTGGSLSLFSFTTLLVFDVSVEVSASTYKWAARHSTATLINA